jgi:hypothetical protein
VIWNGGRRELPNERKADWDARPSLPRASRPALASSALVHPALGRAGATLLVSVAVGAAHNKGVAEAKAAGAC